MSKIEKQKNKLTERIATLELELTTSLHKKSVGKVIDVNAYTSKIIALKKELAALK
jgi:hypothetical protein